jgi:hypothetical protein
MVAWLHNLRSRGLAVQAIVLGTVVLVAFAVVGLVAFRRGGANGLAAAALAATLCLLGATIALITCHLLRGPRRAIAALSLGMASRMGIPLAFGLAVHLRGGPLAEAGLLYYVALFYPVTLAVETLLSLPENRRPTNSDQAASNALS